MTLSRLSSAVTPVRLLSVDDDDMMQNCVSFGQTDFVCVLSESDKDESVQETQTGLTVAPKSVTSALGSLMSSYGDDMTSSESEADTDGMSLVLMMFRARCRHYSSYQSQIKNNYSKYKYPDTNTALCDISVCFNALYKENIYIFIKLKDCL